MNTLNEKEKKEFSLLFEKAKLGYDNAYTPYSHFNVGASLLLKSGEIIYGCNVENASYGLSNCAERTTLFKAYSEGVRKDDIVAFCVIGNTKDPISPCGACRQVMSELLNPLTPVYLTNLDKKVLKLNSSDLLPYSFSGDNLNE